ncbi:polyprotein [Passiflora edulis symptomless virus]|uniref:Genome polyprotein n=26 Tax=Passiflora edulis symptomless virus TaxID=2294149 RepID=A0A346CJM1_9POTY|nr:polyprotein [Passiflora edulis symptomless virus]AXL95770.1 polyprotein [Passiflora edulis symptomless virus]
MAGQQDTFWESGQRASPGVAGLRYLWSAGLSLGWRTRSLIENALKGVRLGVSSVGSFAHFVERHRATFFQRKGVPNEHYYCLKEALENGFDYELETGTYFCPYCSLQRDSIKEMKKAVGSLMHRECTRAHLTGYIETHRDGKIEQCYHSPNGAPYKMVSDDKEDANKNERTIMFGSIETKLTGERLVLPQAVTLREDEPASPKVVSKPIKRTRSLNHVEDKLTWVRKWPIGCEIVDKIENPMLDGVSDLKMSDPRAYDLIPLNVDKRDKIALFREIRTSKKPTMPPSPCVAASVNDLIAETMAIAMNNGIPIEFIDKRRGKVAKRGRFYKIHLKHVYDTDNAHEDDIEDETVRAVLSSVKFGEALTGFNEGLVASSIMRPGWSGTIIRPQDVIDPENFDWADNGICVVQGRHYEGWITNALKVYDEDDIEVYYSSHARVFLDTFNSDVVSDHAPQNDDVGLKTAAKFLKAFYPEMHLGCSKCWDSFHHETIDQIRANPRWMRMEAWLRNRNFMQTTHLANTLRDFMTGTNTPRTLLGLLSPLSDPHLNGISSAINENYEALNVLSQKLDQIMLETHSLPTGSALTEIKNIIMTRIQRHDDNLKLAFEAVEVKIRSLYELHPYVEHMVSSGPKDSLDILRDDNGLPLHHRDVQAVTRIMMIPNVSTTLYKNAMFALLLNWGQIGPKGKEMWTCATHVVSNGAADMSEFIRSCTHVRQPTHECTTALGGSQSVGCLRTTNGRFRTSMIMPALDGIRVGSLHQSNFVLMDFMTATRLRVVNDGYCYIHVFLLMLQHVPQNQVDFFIRDLVTPAIGKLGAWPRFKDFLVVVQTMIGKIGSVGEAPLPALVVDHTRSVMHFVGQMGLGDYGFHQMGIPTVRALFDVSGYLLMSHFAAYQVGGLTKEIVGALASRRNFIDLCKNQPNILVEGLLHPSVIHVLFIAEQKHNALTYCATREEKIVPLISRINALGRHYGLYQSVEEVLQCYMREGMSFYDVLDSCLGGTVSSHFKQELSLKMQRFEESQRMNTLDRIMEKKLDLVSEEAGMRESMRMCLKEGLSFYDYWDLKLQHYAARFRTNIDLSVTTSYGASLRTWVGRKLSMATMWSKDCVNRQRTSWTAWLIWKFAGSLVPYYTLVTVLVFLVTCIYKAVVVVKRLTVGEKVEFQSSKRTSGQVPAKFMALAAIVTALFNNDLSDQWYSCMVKFKSLMSTMFDEYVVFEAGESDQLGLDPVKFLEIALTQDETPTMSGLREHTFSEWAKHKEQTNTLGVLPYTCGVQMKIDKKNIESIAERIYTSENLDFIVSGGVGCGKSTKFVTALSRNGKVLLLEPTRALVTNVEEGLQKVCGMDPTVRMRFYNKIGSHPIMVATYGFALNWFYHGCQSIDEFSFVVFDECHMIQSDMIVLYNFLKARAPHIKIVKVSATPIYGQYEYKPMCDVEVVDAGRMEINTFVENQGRGVATDVSTRGPKILVFVASYSDVDHMSENLRRKGFGVVKADGRTLRNAPKLSETIAACDKPVVYIVATNAIENGVTLDVDCVVDFGEKIVGDVDGDLRCITTKRVKVSKGERIQRLGRVGRYKPGVAIRFGNIDNADDVVTTLVATDAALKSFAYNVPPCLINVDTELINTLTKKQVETAANFELETLYLAHFVRPDGKVPAPIFNEFKAMLLRNCQIGISEKYSCSIFSNRWRKIRNYKTVGLIRHDATPNDDVPLPFHSHHISDEGVHKLTEAIKRADPGKLRGIALPTDQLYTAYQKVSYSEDALPGILATIETLRANEQMKLDGMRTAAAPICSTQLLNFVTLRFMANRERLERQYQNNIERLNNIENTLRSVPVGSSQGEIIAFLNENPEAAQCVLFEGDVSGQIETQILLKKPFVLAKLIVPCLIALAAAGGWYLISRLRSLGEKVDFENNRSVGVDFEGRKKNDIRYRRDKRNEAYFMHEDPSVIADTFGDAYADRRGRSRKGPQFTDRGRKNHPFKNFYDFEPSMFDIVKFFDPVSKHVVERDPKSLNMEEVGMTFDERGAGGSAWGQQKPEKIIAYFMRKGDPTGFKVEMTEHLDTQVSKKNTLLPVGFPGHKGEYRQTGVVAQASPDEFMHLKDTEEVQFESNAAIAPAQNFDRIRPYLVKLDHGAAKQNGFGFRHWIVHNAHFILGDQEQELKKSLIVQSAYGVHDYKDSRKIQHKHVEGLDIVLMKTAIDAPRFRSKLELRPPVEGEKAVLITPFVNETGISFKRSDPSPIHHPDGAGSFWRHYISTRKGDCGSLLVATKDLKVVGMHSLGPRTAASYNYFTPVTDALLHLLSLDEVEMSLFTFSPKMIQWGSLEHLEPPKEFPLVRMLREFVTFQNGSSNTKYCGGNLVAVGEVDRPVNHRHVIKGARKEYVPFLFDHAEHRWALDHLNHRMPSVLSTEAFYADLLKYDQPITVGMIDEALYLRTLKVMVGILKDAGFPSNIEYIWDAQVIAADLNRQSAMGACYHGKKAAWLDAISGEKLELAFQESLRRIHEKKMGVWTGSLKAELRPKAKVLAKKTRVFTAAPIDVLFGAKALVDNFNNTFYANHLRGPWTVGINKFCKGWDRLAKSFNHDWVFLDADGSQFDSSLSPVLFQMVCELRHQFMESDDFAAGLLENLYTQIVYTPISTIDGLVVKKFKGNNSGQPSTVVDNTLILIFVIEYCRIFIKEQIGVDLTFKFVANGDDLLINCPREEAKIIQNSFPEIMSFMGLKYSFDDLHETIETVEYMSHKFVKRGDMYIPKLDKARITSILEWERNEDLSAQISALNAARIEAWGYDDVYRLCDDFLKSFVADNHIGDHLYIPEEFIEALYTGDCSELMSKFPADWFEGDSKEFVEFQMDNGDPEPIAPVLETTPGYEAPVENETAEQTAARNLRNTATFNAATADFNRRHAEWQARRDRANQPQQPQPAPAPAGPAGVAQQEDIPAGHHEGADLDVIELPEQPPRPIWVPRALAQRLTTPSYRSFLAYNPDPMLMRNDVAPQSSVEHWFTMVPRDLGFQQDQFKDVFHAWLVFCMHSGTSEEMKGRSTWQAEDANGNIREYDIRPFVIHAGMSLRSLMRNFSQYCEGWIREKNKYGHFIPTWARNGGMTRKTYAHVGFDFWTHHSQTTNDELHMHGLLIQAHRVGGRAQNLAMSQVVRAERGEVDYRAGDDVAPGVHNAGGARLM